MKKFSLVLCLIFLIFVTTSCNKKGDVEFSVLTASYQIATATFEQINDNDSISLNEMSEKTLTIKVEFEYGYQTDNPNKLPTVICRGSEIVYDLYIDDTKKSSTNIPDDQDEVEVPLVQTSPMVNRYIITNIFDLDISITDIGRYRVIINANYFIKNKRIAESIEFTFNVK